MDIIIIITIIIIIIRPTDPTLPSRINRKKAACLLICPIPTEKNTSVKVGEKLSKNIDLEIEIARIWGRKATAIQVALEVLGLIKKGLEKYIQQVPDNIKIKHELLKITLLGTSRILRKALSIK